MNIDQKYYPFTLNNINKLSEHIASFSNDLSPNVSTREKVSAALSIVGHAVLFGLSLVCETATSPIKRVMNRNIRAYQTQIDNKELSEEKKIELTNDFRSLRLFEGKNDEKYIQRALATYASSRKHYAPIVISYVHSLLETAKNKQQMRGLDSPVQILFLARDGTPYYEVAKKLQQKYPEKYGGIDLHLLYLSRKVMKNTDRSVITEYLKQEGVKKDARCILVDIGFRGSMLEKIKETFAPITAIANIETSYLVSLTPHAKGFIGDLNTKLASVREAGKNASVAWLEDTHQGVIDSPKKIIEVNEEKYRPDTLYHGKTCKERDPKSFLYKTAGMRAIIDGLEDERGTNYTNNEDLCPESWRSASNEMRSDFDQFLKKYRDAPWFLYDYIRTLFHTQGELHYRMTTINHLESHKTQTFKEGIEKLSIHLPRVHAAWSRTKGQWIKPWVICPDNRRWEKIIFYGVQKPLVALSAAVKAVATPLLFCYDLLGAKKDVHFDGGCDNFFRREVFEVYKKQLTDLFETCIQEHCSKVEVLDPEVGAIRELLMQENINAKQWHRMFIHQLRKSAAHPLVAEFAYRRCFEIDLLEQIGEIVASEAPKFKEGKNLEELYQSLSHITSSGGVQQLFDSHLFGNFPFRVGSVIVNGKECQLTRMSSVTKDVEFYPQKVEIIEEFLAFKEHLQRSGKKHLYVNLMSRKQGSEKLRTEQIERMDGDNLLVVSLDKDSDFYHRKNAYAGDSLFGDFKKTFLERIRAENGHFFLPDRIKNSAEEIIDRVQKDYFSKKDLLSQEEKGDFIEIVYLKIIDKLLEEHASDSANFSCKNCIDRGASQLYAYMKYKNNEENKNLLFGPAIMVANRPLFKQRFNRLSSLIGRLHHVRH